MAESQPPQAKTAPAAKTRNPIERMIVWGFIGVLLVLVAIEFNFSNGHSQALKKLQGKIANVDENPSQPEVTEVDVKEVMGDRKPIRTEEFSGEKRAPNNAKRLEVYSWFTLNPSSKREIWVWYGAKGINSKELANVIEVQSSGDVAAQPTPAQAQLDKDGKMREGGEWPEGLTRPPGSSPELAPQFNPDGTLRPQYNADGTLREKRPAPAAGETKTDKTEAPDSEK